MSIYNNFKTDPKIEKEGLWLQFGVTEDEKPIRIRIARAGGANIAFTKRMEHAVKPHRLSIQNESIDLSTINKISRQVYAETVVLDWENIKDENGVTMDFTVDNVIKLFTDLPDLFTEVQQQAAKGALFRAEIRATDAKN